MRSNAMQRPAMPLSKQALLNALANAQSTSNYPHGKKHQGKVRDIYDCDDSLVIVTTDRLSGFDRQLALIPYRGQVLNQLTLWWYDKVKNILPNPFIETVAPNAMKVKKCQVFPVEFVVRGYITGSTDTALWTQYQKGVRDYCGHALPEGLVKNQKLTQAIITPTTKAIDHDQPISPDDIVAKGLMTKAQWQEASEKALAMFSLGEKLFDERGLILVDTKYELGLDPDGTMVVLDEVHTPDSSRIWKKQSYASQFSQGLEPDSFDKEFIRLWFKAQCDPYKDEILPKAPDDLCVELSRRYIEILELFESHYRIE
jgi:phosphoribosylaminoimidazole-succinocarboxamide synthase